MADGSNEKNLLVGTGAGRRTTREEGELREDDHTEEEDEEQEEEAQRLPPGADGPDTAEVPTIATIVECEDGRTREAGEGGGGGFVAVHVGAGYHSPANSELYKNICRQACLQAVSLLKQKQSALDVIKKAMICLEDSPWTNAGMGSNLTVKGTVECDASVMDGQSLQYGSVGAVAGVRNPILLAENLLQTQLQGTMSLGRIPPSLLVGHGAYDWAVRHRIPTIKSESLVTDSSHKAFIKHKRKLDMLEEGSPLTASSCKMRRISTQSPKSNGTDGTWEMGVEGIHSVDVSLERHLLHLQEELHNRNNPPGVEEYQEDISPHPLQCADACQMDETTYCTPTRDETWLLDQNQTDVSPSAPDENPALIKEKLLSPDGSCPVDDHLLDTVGAICVDHCGRVVSAVSSGGIVLKQPGRLGQAAMYGCGCWAENEPHLISGVGVSTSGCGEHLTKALMAKECADCLKDQDDPTTALQQTFVKKFLASPFLRSVDQKLGGCLAVKTDLLTPSKLQVEALWAHTTDSMCLAYMSTKDTQPKALVSRLPEGKKCGRSCVVQSKQVVIPVTPSQGASEEVQ